MIFMLKIDTRNSKVTPHLAVARALRRLANIIEAAQHKKTDRIHDEDGVLIGKYSVDK